MTFENLDRIIGYGILLAIIMSFISGFFFTFDVQIVNAQTVMNNTQLCIDNMTEQVNTSMQLGISGSYQIINTSVPTFCNLGCSKLTNSCRPDFSIQVLEIVGITAGFFVFTFLGIYLADYIPFIDVIVSVLLAVVSAVLGLTDMFSGGLSYVFYGESIIFTLSTFILFWHQLYG